MELTSKPLTDYLNQVELHATKIITEEISDKFVFHTIEHVHKLISGIKEITADEDLTTDNRINLLIAGWFTNLGFSKYKSWKKKIGIYELFDLCNECSIKMAELYLNEISYPKDQIKQVIQILYEGRAGNDQPKSKLARILADAKTIEWASKKGKKRIEQRYQEFLLLGVWSTGKSSYYEAIIEYLNKHEYYTVYGKSVLQPKKESLIQKIEKERKGIGRSRDLALKKELDISDAEFKKLKKSLGSVKGRDERGIQTMFRTTSRNHYTLNQMVDRKANIMISVNAIILSLILSRIFGIIDTFCIHNSPILLMLLSSGLSIFFAVISIIPSSSHGEFSEEQIREKQGNLLYFGNFHNMSFRDYNWGMLQMLSDSDYLYTSMIRDLYFMGQTLKKKHKFIRISLLVFVIGFFLSIVSFLLVSSMSDFHLASEPHI